MTTYDAALPKYSVAAGMKGCMGKKTCSKSLSEEVEDLPTKRCYYLCFQDCSVHKRLEDRVVFFLHHKVMSQLSPVTNRECLCATADFVGFAHIPF